jgi:hypothetical protein
MGGGGGGGGNESVKKIPNTDQEKKVRMRRDANFQLYLMHTYLNLRYVRLKWKHNVPGESVQVQVQGVQVTKVPTNRMT